ncbi:MAG TPA: ABC transporter permease [Dermatophilaceae bacterium]|nr:ABC transporter permease [Dermatophilaceae bacterium]
MSALTAPPRQPPIQTRHTSLTTLLLDQLVYATRELWRGRVAFIFTFLFPLTWLLVLGFIAGNATISPTSHVRMMQYVTPTAGVMGVLYGAYPTVAASLADARERGLLKRFRGTPVPAWVYLAGRIGAAVLSAIASLVLMLAVGVLGYDVQIQWRTALATLVTVVLAIAAFAAAGLAVASLTRSAAMSQAVAISTAVVVAFLSGVMVWGDLPGWADRIAGFFPLKPFNDALRDQFDPFGTGAGWDLGALAVIGAWAVGAALVAARSFRWAPAVEGPRLGRRRQPAAVEAPEAPVGTEAIHGAAALTADLAGRPSEAAMVQAQALWATRGALRDLGWVFFAVAMPVGLYAFIASVIRGQAPSGPLPYAVELAAGMIAWGVVVNCFVNLPEAVARARDQGILKRLQGAPLPAYAYLAGRLLSVLAIVWVTAALVLVIGRPWFDLRPTAAGLPLAAAVLVLGSGSLAACGFLMAALLPNSRAVTAVGLGIALPLAFFSNVFAISATPSWMTTVGAFFPLEHLAKALSLAFAPGGATVSWSALGVMTAWLLGAGFLAARRGLAPHS